MKQEKHKTIRGVFEQGSMECEGHETDLKQLLSGKLIFHIHLLS